MCSCWSLTCHICITALDQVSTQSNMEFWHMSTCFAEPGVSDLYYREWQALHLFLWLPYPKSEADLSLHWVTSWVVYHIVFPECTCTYSHIWLTAGRSACSPNGISDYNKITWLSCGFCCWVHTVHCTGPQPVHPAQLFICSTSPRSLCNQIVVAVKQVLI